ncbi:MAG: hypothetical protein O2821_13610, partial [Chloroflexi bacterium]|nr:hypothetical protein [Chloroflexota bacterium]
LTIQFSPMISSQSIRKFENLSLTYPPPDWVGGAPSVCAGCGAAGPDVTTCAVVAKAGFAGTGVGARVVAGGTIAAGADAAGAILAGSDEVGPPHMPWRARAERMSWTSCCNEFSLPARSSTESEVVTVSTGPNPSPSSKPQKMQNLLVSSFSPSHPGQRMADLHLK